METHVVPFLGGNIYCYTQGKGPCVILLHGFLGASEVWKYVIPYLSKSFKVLCMDLPGHGKSDCFGYAHSMELMADAVKAMLKHFHIRSCVVIGHSMGGYVALAFAKKYPEMVKGLCLFHSTALPDSEEKKKDRNKAIKIVKHNPKLFIQPTIKNLFSQRNLKYLKEELKMTIHIALHTPVQGIIAALIGMRDRPSSLRFIQSATFPIMFVIGKQDNVLPYASLLEQCEQVPHKECLFLEYDGHYSQLENPRATGIALRQFSRKCFKPHSL